jgi:transposase
MLVAEEAVQIRVLRRQGKSIREIARRLDVSRYTVRRYLRGEGQAGLIREYVRAHYLLTEGVAASSS